MIMTENEAGNKICPETKEMCSGTYCPAWRWWEYPKIDSCELTSKYGYCGLAGKPLGARNVSGRKI